MSPRPTRATRTGPPAPGTGASSRPGSLTHGRRSRKASKRDRVSTGMPSSSPTSRTRSSRDGTTSTMPSSAQRRTTMRSLEVRSGVGQQPARHHHVDRDVLLGDVPPERVDDLPEAQHAGRAPAVEIGVADDLGEVEHGTGERRIGAEPAFDRVEDLADLESHRMLPPTYADDYLWVIMPRRRELGENEALRRRRRGSGRCGWRALCHGW